MSIQTAQKIYKEVQVLKKETKALKELIFLLLHDPEGEYQKKFVKKILNASSSKPQFIFTQKDDFLRKIS